MFNRHEHLLKTKTIQYLHIHKHTLITMYDGDEIQGSKQRVIIRCCFVQQLDSVALIHSSEENQAYWEVLHMHLCHSDCKDFNTGSV